MEKEIGGNLASVMNRFLELKATPEGRLDCFAEGFKKVFNIDLENLFGPWEIVNIEVDTRAIDVMSNIYPSIRIYTLFNSKTGQIRTIRQIIKTGELRVVGLV